jgi:hypothetical protein
MAVVGDGHDGRPQHPALPDLGLLKLSWRPPRCWIAAFITMATTATSGRLATATEAALVGRLFGDSVKLPEERLERLSSARPVCFRGRSPTQIRFSTFFKGFPCPKSTPIVSKISLSQISQSSSPPSRPLSPSRPRHPPAAAAPPTAGPISWRPRQLTPWGPGRGGHM